MLAFFPLSLSLWLRWLCVWLVCSHHVGSCGGEQGRTHKGADLFTAHFNEELSAFDGRLITDQVEHVVHCIDAVLQAYRGAT